MSRIPSSVINKMTARPELAGHRRTVTGQELASRHHLSGSHGPFARAVDIFFRLPSRVVGLRSIFPSAAESAWLMLIGIRAKAIAT